MLLLPVWSIYLVSVEYQFRLSEGGIAHSQLLALTALSLLTAGAYFLNQVHDVESDRINRKLGFLQRGMLTRKGMMRAYHVTSLSALALSATVSLYLFTLMVFLYVAGYAYSAPPFRLKDRPVSGYRCEV